MISELKNNIAEQKEEIKSGEKRIKEEIISELMKNIAAQSSELNSKLDKLVEKLIKQ